MVANAILQVVNVEEECLDTFLVIHYHKIDYNVGRICSMKLRAPRNSKGHFEISCLVQQSVDLLCISNINRPSVA